MRIVRNLRRNVPTFEVYNEHFPKRYKFLHFFISILPLEMPAKPITAFSFAPLCGFLSYKPILLIILYSGMLQNFVDFSSQCAGLRLKSALFWNITSVRNSEYFIASSFLTHLHRIYLRVKETFPCKVIPCFDFISSYISDANQFIYRNHHFTITDIKVILILFSVNEYND